MNNYHLSLLGFDNHANILAPITKLTAGLLSTIDNNYNDDSEESDSENEDEQQEESTETSPQPKKNNPDSFDPLHAFFFPPRKRRRTAFLFLIFCFFGKNFLKIM